MDRICIIKATKAYGDKEIFRNINWKIEHGDVWKLCGVSGAGKTTLLRIIMGLEKLDNGKIEGLHDVRISTVFQEQRLCGWLTPVQNIKLVCSRADNREIEDLLRELIPEICLSQSVDTFSGGMQRMVAVARALLAESELLLMDEAFAGLDRDSIERTMRCIDKNRRGRTTIFVSHENYTLPGMVKIYTLSSVSGRY